MEGKKAILLLAISGLSYMARASGQDSLLARSNRELNAGRLHEAKVLADEALRHAERSGDRMALARASYHLANAFQASGNFQGAAPLYDRVVREADISQDSLLLSEALTRYGVMKIKMRRYHEGEANIMYAIHIAQALHDTTALAYCYQHLGNSSYAQDQWEDALNFYQKSLGFARSKHLTTVVAACLQNIGQAYEGMGRVREAKAFTKRSLAIRIARGDEYYIHQCYKNLLYIHYNQQAMDSVMQTELAYFGTLERQGMEVNDHMLEPLAYLTESILESYDTLRSQLHAMEQQLQTYSYLLLALGILILVLSGVLVVALRKAKRARAMLETDQPAFVVNSTLGDRIKPLLKQKNKMLAPCYALLAAGYNVTRIADILNRDRTTVSHWVREIANTLGLTLEELRNDALKHGVCVEETVNGEASGVY